MEGEMEEMGKAEGGGGKEGDISEGKMTPTKAKDVEKMRLWLVGRLTQWERRGKGGCQSRTNPSILGSWQRGCPSYPGKEKEKE